MCDSKCLELLKKFEEIQKREKVKIHTEYIYRDKETGRKDSWAVVGYRLEYGIWKFNR